jgi:WD40 repeat protein
MAELRSAIFWVLCPKQSLHCYIRLWSLPDGNHIKTLSGHNCGVEVLVISPDGSFLVSGSHDTTIRLWSLPDGNHIKTLSGHNIAK